MKNVILILLGILIVLYTITIAFSAFTTQTRKNELEKNVSRIVESALKNYYKQWNEEQVQEELIEEIVQCLGENANVVVTVQACDLQKGIISVRVEETFWSFNGKSKTLVCEKTAIMEQHSKEEDTVLVSFMVGAEVYKEYQLMAGESCPVPKLPGAEYTGWAEQETGAVIEGEIENLWEDKVYVAIME